ncbi:PoNe immunity protein domain-containing protein [Mesonia sp. K4-1]|uniref:PoNe immunity protein domain-containing protein n=1 Tax=Mesonia sp. K4-1 TaxID=2602760 RepID=UPI00164FC40B|nr:PoNe immunity protein domain-containing protein [Mesonia sp. K4-1]
MQKKSLEEQKLRFQLYITIAQYSKESSKIIVKENIKKTIDSFSTAFSYNPEDFYGAADIMIWTLSIAVLCDLEIGYLKKIKEVLENEGVQDDLLDFLLKSYFTDSSLGGGFVQKPPYENLQIIFNVDNEDEGLAILQNYLKNIWYQEHRGDKDGQKSFWVGYHKKSKNLPKNDPNYHSRNIFFGYWAWETAAIVKIKGWDDSSLKNLDYYPYDAVHW